MKFPLQVLLFFLCVCGLPLGSQELAAAKFTLSGPLTLNRVALGFSPQQVTVALGKPISTTSGQGTETWEYGGLTQVTFSKAKVVDIKGTLLEESGQRVTQAGMTRQEVTGAVGKPADLKVLGIKNDNEFEFLVYCPPSGESLVMHFLSRETGKVVLIGLKGLEFSP